MGLTHSSSTNLRNLLTKTKTTPPSELTPTIYEIFCLDYSSTYNGQTYRPLIHRMKEHERCHRLNNAYDETLDKKLCPCSLLPHHWTQSFLHFSPLTSSAMIRTTSPLDQTSDSAESTTSPPSPPTSTPQLILPQPSFNSTLSSLFGPTAPSSAKKSSYLTERLATYSCHISFLKACRDHAFIPKLL
ncbi:hypothetical protein ACHWQZ_G013050 [Mnemiopsis leidyi]